jgi:hypothetical protein
VYAASNLDAYDDATDFDSGYKNVAIVDLDARSSDPKYTALQLTGENHCIYLKHTSPPGPPGWSAVAVVAPVCDATTVPPANTSATIPVVPEQPSASATDYPPVARFVEGTNDQTFIGVRCGNVWCIIGASNPGDIARIIHPLAGKREKVRGWHDQQQLADPTSPPMKRSFIASVVPDSSLEKPVALNQWVRAAYITIPQSANVPAIYKTKYGFEKGRTFEVWMYMTDPKEGIARITMSGTGKSVYRRIRRTPLDQYGVPVPATARWGWNPNDEEIWFRCDVGCCIVEVET